MARKSYVFPHVHLKTAILAALVLLVPLFVLVASAPKAQDTTTHAMTPICPEGNCGGTGSFIAAPKITSIISYCITNINKKRQIEFKVSWSSVAGAKNYRGQWITTYDGGGGWSHDPRYDPLYSYGDLSPQNSPSVKVHVTLWAENSSGISSPKTNADFTTIDCSK